MIIIKVRNVDMRKSWIQSKSHTLGLIFEMCEPLPAVHYILHELHMSVLLVVLLIANDDVPG